MKISNGQDAMLCNRCGDIATGFHEDFGNMCQSCSVCWHDRSIERPEPEYVCEDRFDFMNQDR